ncbi:hypothetical protein RQP46_007695 [Phenoliferia psychrophenolica]
MSRLAHPFQSLAQTLASPLRSAGARAASTSAGASTSTSASSSLPPTPSTSSAAAPSSAPPATADPKTHYLVTLLRSPLHLPAPLLATCQSIGLSHRLSSSIVPITRENAGFILRVKELVGVRTISAQDVEKASDPAWRDRAGEGRQGSGFVTKGEPGRGVIRVGRERARGDERGFRVVR